MSEMHLRQPGFTFSACGPFTKNKERILKFTEKGDWRYIYQKELHKVAFNMTWLMYILRIYLEGQHLMKHYVIKHFNLLKILSKLDIKKFLLHWFIFFDKEPSATSANLLDLILQEVLLKVKLSQTKNQLKNYTNQLI